MLDAVYDWPPKTLLGGTTATRVKPPDQDNDDDDPGSGSMMLESDVEHGSQKEVINLHTVLLLIYRTIHIPYRTIDNCSNELKPHFQNNSTNLAYVLSWLETSDFTTNHMRVQIVNLTSGHELCRREFTYARDSFHPSASSFALVGPRRRLAYCGGTLDARCYLLDVFDGKKEVLTELGPFMYSHASLVTSEEKWLLIAVE